MYAKIHRTIFESSIANDYQVRHVFEDLLKLADQDGVVDMTHESIARITNVPIEIINHAISVLEAPDPKSRKPDDDGRRIRLIDEHRDWGWFIVNYGYYRSIVSSEQKREHARDRMRKFRDAHATPGNASPSVSVVPSDNSFDQFWTAYPRKCGKGAAQKAWNKVKGKPDIAVILKAVEEQMKSDQWRKDGGQYIPMPATWLNQERWNDDPTSWYSAQKSKPATFITVHDLRTRLEILKQQRAHADNFNRKDDLARINKEIADTNRKIVEMTKPEHETPGRDR